MQTVDAGAGVLNVQMDGPSKAREALKLSVLANVANALQELFTTGCHPMHGSGRGLRVHVHPDGGRRVPADSEVQQHHHRGNADQGRRVG